MVSPFKTFEEFTAAKGPIYTFGNSPGMITFLLIVSALLFLYFVYASFTIKRTDAPQSPLVLSVLLITGLVSLLQGAYTQSTQKADQATVEARISRVAGTWQPLALVGLMGGAAATRRRRSRKPARTRLR